MYRNLRIASIAAALAVGFPPGPAEAASGIKVSVAEIRGGALVITGRANAKAGSSVVIDGTDRKARVRATKRFSFRIPDWRPDDCKATLKAGNKTQPILIGNCAPKGEAGLVAMGSWSSTATYPAGAVVTHDGSSWAAKVPVSVGIVPGTDAGNAVWMLVAAKGADGLGNPDGQVVKAMYSYEGQIDDVPTGQPTYVFASDGAASSFNLPAAARVLIVGNVNVWLMSPSGPNQIGYSPCVQNIANGQPQLSSTASARLNADGGEATRQLLAGVTVLNLQPGEYRLGFCLSNPTSATLGTSAAQIAAIVFGSS